MFFPSVFVVVADFVEGLGGDDARAMYRLPDMRVLFEEHHVMARSRELPACIEPGRTAADDDDIAHCHVNSRGTCGRRSLCSNRTL